MIMIHTLVKHFLINIICLIIIAASYVNAGTVDEGLKSWSLGDYKAAMEIWKPLARQGNSDAQNHLGMIHYKGEGVPINTVRAKYWLEKSAENGNSKGQVNLGVWYYVVTKDYKRAAFWYKKAAIRGNVTTEINLAYMYYAGIGVDKDYKVAFAYYESAADKGNVIGFNGMGVAYLNGYGVEKDLNLAKYWFEKAANQGNDIAKQNLDLVIKKINENPISNTINTKAKKFSSKPRTYPVYNIIVNLGPCKLNCVTAH